MKKFLNNALLFLIISISVVAMELAPPPQEVIPEKGVKKEVKKSQRFKKLDLNVTREKTSIPQGRVGKTHAFIDLQEKEDLTLETFKDLIQKQQSKNLPFVLAVVTTRPDNIRTYRFYSAIELNNHLFKPNLSKKRFNLAPTEFLDPKNFKVIIGDILYFTINSLDDEFKYLGSDSDFFIGSQNKPEFFYYFFKAIQGDPGYQADLGKFFFKGRGVNQDYNEAARWFKVAAAQGEPEAQFNLATMHVQGLGMQRDYNEAARLFRLAAEQTHVEAQNSLGVMYRDGLGLEKDYKKAEKWFEAAAEQGFELAKDNLKKLQESLKE